MTPDPLTPSPDSLTLRIYTRCPACGNDTLAVDDNKHLICTWIACPDPTLIDRVRDIQRELAALVKEREDQSKSIEQLHAKLAAENEKRLTAEDALAERDREVSGMKEQAFRADEEIRAATANIRNLTKEREELRARNKSLEDYTPKTNLGLIAALAERDREIEELRVDKQVAEQTYCDRLAALRAQLAETEGKLKEAEEQWKFAEEVSGLSSKRIEELLEQNLELMRQLGCLHDKDRVRTTEHNILVQENRSQAAELLALQAHVGECRSVLKLVDATSERAYTAALKLLSARPDLTLIEEVMEAAEETATIFDELDTVQWDENGCPVSYQGTQERIIQLLARLNPSKL